jgi:hypothetical protein
MAFRVPVIHRDFGLAKFAIGLLQGTPLAAFYALVCRSLGRLADPGGWSRGRRCKLPT